MTRDQLFQRAREMVAQSGNPMTVEQALSILAKRRPRRRTLGVLHPMRADRTAFANVEPPARPMWWNDPDR